MEPDVSQIVGAVVAIVLLVFAIMFIRSKRPARRVVWTESAPPSVVGDGHGAIEDDPDVRRLIASDRKLDAVKLVRERTGLGLKESLAVVERIRL